jgi:uncharacterized protein
MYINRHIEGVIDRISKRKPVVVITGARQVGKSTMLRQIYKGIRYVALNNPSIRQSAIDNPSMFFDLNKPPIIVDEIQKAGQLFDYVKDIVDEDKQKGRFYLTGPQSLKLTKNVSESLAGRAGIVRMLGLSYRELNKTEYYLPFLPTDEHINSVIKFRNVFDVNAIIEKIHTGSFPELYEKKGDLKDWSDFYSSYFQTYIEKDIRDIFNIQDESAFIKFVKSCASLTGEMLNYSKIAEICGKDIKTIQKWMSLLESSGLVYLLQPYYNNLNKRMIKTPKLYFLDTGLACWLLGWNSPKQLISGAMWGHIFETYVVIEILKSYYNDGVYMPPLYYYRDKDKNEVDLVIEAANTIYPIEIKTTSDPVKSMVNSYRCLKDIPAKTIGQGAIICMAKTPMPLVENVWIIPVDLI